MVVEFIKTNDQDDEYNYHDSLQVHLMERIGNWEKPVSIMHHAFETSAPHWRIPGVFTFTVSELQWKQRLAGKKLRVKLSRPLNIKNNSLNRLYFFWTTADFTGIFFMPLKSSPQHDINRLKSYLFRQLFSLHVFYEHATWIQSCKRGGEPRVKSPTNPRSAPELYSEAVRKGASTGLSRVSPQWVGWGGIQMASALHHSNWSFFLWIIFPTCFVLPVFWTLFLFNSTTHSYCCITV